MMIIARRHVGRTGVPLVVAGLVIAGAASCRRGPAAKRTAGDTGGASPVEISSPGTATDAGDTVTQASPLPASSAEFHSASDLSRIADELARGTTTGKTVAAHPALHYVQARRIANGTPEIHDDWIDVTVVQAGRATLLVGGRVSGDRVASPGEHRGGIINGGSRRLLGPGDLVTIPAGVPHQYEVTPGDSLRYLTIKVHR